MPSSNLPAELRKGGAPKIADQPALVARPNRIQRFRSLAYAGCTCTRPWNFDFLNCPKDAKTSLRPKTHVYIDVSALTGLAEPLAFYEYVEWSKAGSTAICSDCTTNAYFHGQGVPAKCSVLFQNIDKSDSKHDIALTLTEIEL